MYVFMVLIGFMRILGLYVYLYSRGSLDKVVLNGFKVNRVIEFCLLFIVFYIFYLLLFIEYFLG